MNMPLKFRPIDADHHYYESLDAFTRYQDPKMKRRGVQVVRDGKRVYMVVADKINRFIPNPTFNPVSVAGCTELLFRGQVPEGVDPKSLSVVEALRPEYQNRDKRVEAIEAQGLDAVLMFPTMAVGIEQSLTHDPEATMAALSAFNRWLEDDWGFAYKNRIFSLPLLSLADPKAAEAELASVLKRGARAIHLRPAPVPSASGPRSFGHPAHERFWSMLEEANVPVAFHLSDSGYLRFAAAWGGRAEYEPFAENDALDGILVGDRAIYDTMASLIVHGVFHRHPKLRVVSVENGSDWVANLVKALRKKANQMPSAFPEDPLDVLRRNVWVTPYYEEDIKELADTVGVDKVLFGSDWPHGEALANPVDFTKEISDFSAADVRKVMRTNVVDYLGFNPVQ
jgi:predicted TIM-barrel fold metal-dependent hydrolase